MRLPAQTSERYGNYVISWVKRSSFYYLVELPLRLRNHGRSGDISAVSSEAAQAQGRKFVHECKALVATGEHHRCATKRHLGATSAGWSGERFREAAADGRQRMLDRRPAMVAVWDAAIAALSFQFSEEFRSIWRSLDANAGDVGAELDAGEEARTAAEAEGDATGSARELEEPLDDGGEEAAAGNE